ncbi:malonate decarboxylase holo-ACP synthase [Dactylosporangium aurantiacum]|uniref:Malonate decarboxylase holo-ACP synthase n=1 Tax=Dactylosporangium aurantiacum TaxID=35754 RepID=A0A9Q9IM48_9ACTN|nr:malonate decarboxylase holo-ACP synthase [Dactylosporangium aurantiacum]MDG6106317.1 malonate decarboxylase holo-ACP synthase [Dactylosporangium aurantiacum]UWZ58191.1 malonate decarboxylase holo-ACP synthase [Dactylosporangium aurantiacum]
MSPVEPAMRGARAHDLVRLADPAAVLTGTEPAWVAESVTGTPWAVVRRGTAPRGHVAVGVRGPARHQRHATQVPAAAVSRVVRPEQLRPHDTGTDRTPTLAALRALRPALDRLGHDWGPVGGTGFELATGRPVTTAASDLDLVVRCDPLPAAGWAATLLDTLRAVAAPVRVDCLIETAVGAVALAELATGADRLVLRTAGGACLVDPARIRAA